MYYLVVTFSITYLKVQVDADTSDDPVVAAGRARRALRRRSHWSGGSSDRFGRRPVYLVGALAAGTWGFFAFPMMDSGNYLVIMAAVIIGLVIHAFMYAPQPAIMAEMFPTRMRYSGVSLGYQVTSIVAGSLAPIIAVKLLESLRLLGADRAVPGRRRGRHPGRGAASRARPRASTLATLDEADARRTLAEGGRCHERTSTAAPPWSPAVRAGSARRVPGSSPPAARVVTVADVDDAGAKALARRDRRKGLGGRPSRRRRAGGPAARDRHPGQQRRRAEHQPDRRFRARALPARCWR